MGTIRYCISSSVDICLTPSSSIACQRSLWMAPSWLDVHKSFMKAWMTNGYWQNRSLPNVLYVKNASKMSIILFYFIKMVSDKTSNFCNTYFDKKFATSVDWFVKSFQRDMCIYWCVLTYFAICIHGWLGSFM